MIKEIKYNGFTETPADYECPDGDLATVTGLVPEDEALHPVQPPVSLFTLPDGYSVVYVHANATGYKHYIIRYDHIVLDPETQQKVIDYTDFFWIDEAAANGTYYDWEFTGAKTGVYTQQNPRLLPVNYITTFTGKEIFEVNGIGNTLLFLTDDGMYYSLWKNATVGYKNLGNHIPETQISFGLRGQADKTLQSFEVNIHDEHNTEADAQANAGKSIFDDDVTYITENYINIVNDNILAKVNKLVADKTEAGKFLFPFFVRYAYRLYDETLIMHSAPVLMVTDTYLSPHCFILFTDLYAFGERAVLGTMMYDLNYIATVPPELDDWSDIVKSVDVFISAPLYTYNQAGKIKGHSTRDNELRGFGIFNIPSDADIYNIADIDNTHYSRWFTSQLTLNLSDPQGIGDRYGKMEYDLPRFSDEEMKDKIRSCQNFYLLKSYRISELNTTTRTKIPVPEGYLTSLVNREAMTDDFNSHDLMIPQLSFNYNSRLNLANISAKLGNKFAPTSVVPFNDYFYQDYTTPYTTPTATYTFYIFIEQGNKEMVIQYEGTAETMGYLNPFRYFFFPNPNAYKAVIKKTVGGTDSYYELPLEKHDFLNGAVYFDGWYPQDVSTSEPTVTSDNVVEQPNKLYTSEVDNPFVFLTKGVQTVGISQIVGIRPAVKAMSPSQYGQFKFYVFTLDGVWAFEVSKEGYLQYPQLVAPDIVLGDARSITQIDGAVLFASERGIMKLDGSTCSCISDLLNSPKPFVPFGSTAANDVLPGLRNVCGDFLATINPVPFRTFIQDCSMLYDYPHQRIILYSPTYPYAYAFSLKSKLWGMIPSKIQSTVLDYPYATAMGLDADSHPVMIDYSREPDESITPAPAVQGLIITRPLKLDMPDVLKTVESIIQRGQFRKGHVQSVLYGSRDLYNWQLVWSSADHYLRGFRGTPYKYFRLALLCSFDKDESLFGCTVQYQPRYQNQLR